MMRTKLLPTSAPKPIPPEFMEKFAKHGWRRVEMIWGRSTVLAWRKVIGGKRMAEVRKRYLAEMKGQGEAKKAARYSGSLNRGFGAQRGGKREFGV